MTSDRPLPQIGMQFAVGARILTVAEVEVGVFNGWHPRAGNCIVRTQSGARWAIGRNDAGDGWVGVPLPADPNALPP